MCRNPSTSNLGAVSHLKPLVTDPNASQQQKVDCLKLLKIVLKNLLDKEKRKDSKYRQLRLENEKIKNKLTIFPCASQLLIDHIGFLKVIDETTKEQILRIDESSAIQNSGIISTSLQYILDAITELSTATPAPPKKYLTEKQKARVMLEEIEKQDKIFENQQRKRNVALMKKEKSLKGGDSKAGKLSEKQRARILLEEKQKQEKLIDHEQRKKNVAMIKQDKFVRENDPNWKSGVSAACAKSGTGISTFRDKYGEN